MQHYEYDAVVAAIARRVRDMRKTHGLTQMTMFSDYGYHLTQWRNIESGRGLSLQSLIRLANTFEITLAELVADIEKSDGPGFGSKGFPGPAKEGAE